MSSKPHHAPQSAGERLRALADAGRSFSEAAIDFDRLLVTVARRVTEVAADTCLIRLLAPGGERLEPAAISDVDPAALAWFGERLASDPVVLSDLPLTRRVLERREPELVTLNHERAQQQAAAEEWSKLERHAPTSLLVVPLIARGSPLGVAYVARRERSFDAEDARLVCDLLTWAAVVISNARLIDEAQDRAREALRSERRFAATLSSIADAVIATDAFGAVTFVNPHAEQLTGFSEPEARGRSLEEVFRASRDGAGAILVARDGESIPIEHSRAPIVDERGRPAGEVIAFHDASEARKAAERRRMIAEASAVLLSSLDYEQTLAKLAELAVPELADWCVVDLVTERGALSRVAISHSDPDRVALVRAYHERWPPNSEADAAVLEVVRSGEPAVASHIPPELIAAIEPADRRQLVEQLGVRSYLIVPMIARGRILGALTCVMAESGRRYDAKDLEFAQDLAHRCAYAVDNARLFRAAQDAIAARDEFFSVASHELRTPLTPLRLQLEMLASTLASLSPPDGALAKVRVARRQVERLTRLVESLLDVSRITAGRLRLEPVSGDLGEIVKGVVELHAEEAARAGCEIELSIDSPVPGSWDRGRVDQIVTNLLSNAIKYSASKPIQVRVENAGDDQVTISITDQGLGIAERDVERIFRCFERGVSAQHYGGLGLGLYIARQLARAHGGDVSVDSRLGAGATFVLRLPRTPHAARDEHTPGRAPAARPVLVVDDDADIRDSVAELLKDRGYRVETAANGREALTLMGHSELVPRVILLDMMMPVMDGWEFVSEMRKLPWLLDVPVVVFTAHGDARRIASDLQVSGCIKKPFQLAELMQTLERFEPAIG